MGNKFALMLIYFLPAILLGACRLTDPQDLRFESVEKEKLSELVGAWPGVESLGDANSNAITLLKINFSSQFDFVKLAKGFNPLHVSYRAFACGNGSVQGRELFVLSYLRIKDFSLGDVAYSKFPDLERFRGSNGRFIYHALMPIAGEELKRLFGDGTVPVPGQTFNFISGEPLDNICLQVVAAAMWPGPTLQSNVVRVPAQEVSRLIN